MLECEVRGAASVSTELKTGTDTPSGWTMRLVVMGLVMLGLLAAALLVGVVTLLMNSRSAATPQVEAQGLTVGEAAPDFAARTLDGEVIRLSELRGRAVWLNFWASWCTPCRAEMPELVTVGREARQQGVILVAISTGESDETARDYLKRSGHTALPAALDADGRVATLYQVRNLPTHVFIDAEGTVREVRLGSMDGEDMRTAVRRLLE